MVGTLVGRCRLDRRGTTASISDFLGTLGRGKVLVSGTWYMVHGTWLVEFFAALEVAV